MLILQYTRLEDSVWYVLLLLFFSLIDINIEVCFAVITPRPVSVKLEVGLSDIWMFTAAFAFPIPVNIRLGYGGNSLRVGSAMKHEQPSCQPMRKWSRQDGVWHFIITDEGMEQQTKHFYWLTSMSLTLSTIGVVRCSMRWLSQIATTQLHSRCLFFLLCELFKSKSGLYFHK